MSRPAIGFEPVRGEDPRSKTMYRWDGQPKRAPLKGEFYLSGAEVVAYEAKHNLTAAYFIAVPVTADLPTPVKAVEWACHARTTIKDATGRVLAEVSGHGRHTDEDEMIAAEIERRVNAHDDLAALVERAMREGITQAWWVEAIRVRAAIAKAK